MTIASQVDAIMALMAEAEAAADTLKDALEAIPAHLAAIKSDPENANVGALIVKGFSLRARAIGLNTKAEVWSLHSDMTEAAKQRGIDVPSIESGGR